MAQMVQAAAQAVAVALAVLAWRGQAEAQEARVALTRSQAHL